MRLINDNVTNAYLQIYSITILKIGLYNLNLRSLTIANLSPDYF